MAIYFSWWKFTYTAPKAITEAQYKAARARPDELRRSAWAEVRATVRGMGMVLGILTVLATGCFVAAAQLDYTDPQSTSHSIADFLLLIGVVMAASIVLTAGSLLHYTTAAIGFWRAVIKVAGNCQSYAAFQASWKPRRERGIGVDRQGALVGSRAPRRSPGGGVLRALAAKKETG
jgi:hypothetical protein